jgi:hypothetical protein
MATITKELRLDVPAPEVWDAVRDAGAVHERLLPGFIGDVRLEGDTRVCTLGDGSALSDRIVDIDDETRRVVYTVVAGPLPTEHHSASMQVLADGDGASRLVWINDFLPNEFQEPLDGLLDSALELIERTLSAAKTASTYGDIGKVRARADDYFARLEGADGWHLLERDMPKRWIAQQQRARRNPADAPPARASARARGGGDASVAAVRQRWPEHLCGGGQRLAPGRGEILVRVQACDLSHVASELGSGAMSQPFARGARYICVDAAGTVIATGDRVTRFAVGDEVFGDFSRDSWAWGGVFCGRTAADGPHVELRPDGLDPVTAAALAHSGLIAKTILRAAELKPGTTALVIGASSSIGVILLSLLAETGVHVIDSSIVEHETGDPAFDALTTHPDLGLLVDLVSWGEPYFITAARQGTIVSALPRPDGPGIPRISISAQHGDLATLAQRALDERQHIDIAHVHPIERSARRPRPTATPPARPALALDR